TAERGRIMNFRKTLIAFFCVAVLCFCAEIKAQTAQGRISGQVTDSSGGTVAGAVVSIENLGTGVKRVLETTSSGDYVAPQLEPGTYSVTVEASRVSRGDRERVQIEGGNYVEI